MTEKLNFKVYLLRNKCSAKDLYTFSMMLSVNAKIEKNRGAFEEGKQIHYGLKQDERLTKSLNYFQRTVDDMKNILTSLK